MFIDTSMRRPLSRIRQVHATGAVLFRSRISISKCVFSSFTLPGQEIVKMMQAPQMPHRDRCQIGKSLQGRSQFPQIMSGTEQRSFMGVA